MVFFLRNVLSNLSPAVAVGMTEYLDRVDPGQKNTHTYNPDRNSYHYSFRYCGL